MYCNQQSAVISQHSAGCKKLQRRQPLHEQRSSLDQATLAVATHCVPRCGVG
ncbi:hypothetical protein BDW68DRAFT_150518 [Aspergillus falconensis]